MKKHTMRLLGGTRGELRVPVDVLLETVGALLEGARQATRFFIEGESTRKGPVVSLGEVRVLAKRNDWGDAKLRSLSGIQR